MRMAELRYMTGEHHTVLREGLLAVPVAWRPALGVAITLSAGTEGASIEIWHTDSFAEHEDTLGCGVPLDDRGKQQLRRWFAAESWRSRGLAKVCWSSGHFSCIAWRSRQRAW